MNVERNGLSDRYKEGYASIDFGKPYKAYCDPNDTWNGWHKPFFSQDVFFEIVNDQFVYVDEKEDTIILASKDLSDEDKQDESYQTVVFITPTGHYVFDGVCWDFDEDTKPKTEEVEQLTKLLQLWDWLGNNISKNDLDYQINTNYFAIEKELENLLVKAQRGELE